MSLQQKLDAQKKATETSAPKEALEVMHRATENLAKSGIMNRIVKKGDKAPDFMLNDINGNVVTLKERLSRGHVVRYAEVNPDYTVRPDPSHTIDVLKEIIS